MIGSGFFFSFVVGRMASVMSKLDSVRSAQGERLDTVTAFLKDVDLPRSLSKRCECWLLSAGRRTQMLDHRAMSCKQRQPPTKRRVLDFFKQQQVKPYDRQKVLATLPFELRSKILRQLYAGVISRVPLLQAMAHDDMFMSDVCVRLQTYSCTRESFVFQRGEKEALRCTPPFPYT